MSGAYGYGYEVNSGWKGYNQTYTLDDTSDNLLSKDPNAVPCCAQKRPTPFPVAWPPTDTYAAPRANETRVWNKGSSVASYQEKLPPFSQAKLFYVAIAVLIMVILMKLVL